jgi:uncharacterized membrane protein YkoI
LKKYLIPAVIAALFLAPSAFAADKFTGKLETALKAAQAKHPGDVNSLEAELDKGKAIYEFDIQGKDGKEWEVEVDASTGKVTEENQEVKDASDPLFKAKAKITQDEAKKIALAKHAGEVVESEFKIESDGNPSYEFDIKSSDGKEWEIEVDAVTSKIVGEQEEVYQIGLD